MNWQKEPGADDFFSPITRSKRQLQCMEYDDCTQLKKSNLKPNICLIASIAVRISVKVIQEKGQLIIVCLSGPTPVYPPKRTLKKFEGRFCSNSEFIIFGN